MACVAVVALGGVAYYVFSRPEPVSHQPAASVGQSLAQKNTASLGDMAANTVLIIESSPPGAQIFIDGVFKGKSPLHLDLPLGKHEVRLNLPNHYEWEAQLQLREEVETPLYVRLVPME
jgi:hypothetical protein